MHRTEKILQAHERATQKKLRCTFRSALAAQPLDCIPDLTQLTTELTALRAPGDRRAAGRFAKTAISAAQAHFAQGNLDTARTILLDIVSVCRQYNLMHQELKASALLVGILRQQGHLQQARTYIDQAIETAKRSERKSQLRRFEEELAVVCALIAHNEYVRSDKDRVFFKEETPASWTTEQEFTVKQLDPAEAVGARRARMRKTVFNRDDELSTRDPRRTGGRRKSVFVSTLLKKGFGVWMRKFDND